jgi:hypothetical protein
MDTKTQAPVHPLLEEDHEAIVTKLRADLDEALGVATDAVGLIKVLANQIHGLPQASITALSHRTFNEMFDAANGAAYGQAKAIVDRFELLAKHSKEVTDSKG